MPSLPAELKEEAYRRIDVMAFVAKAHWGQHDKSGEDYFSSHLIPVAEAVPPHLFIPALAHDILEDTQVTSSDLYDSKIFTAFEILLIHRLTHQSSVSYEQYLHNVRKDYNAVTIKLADIRNNMSPSRFSKLSTSEQVRLKSKYKKAIHILYGMENE